MERKGWSHGPLQCGGLLELKKEEFTPNIKFHPFATPVQGGTFLIPRTYSGVLQMELTPIKTI